MSRQRFLAKSLADDLAGTRAGLIHLLDLLKQPQRAVIVVPDLGSLKHSILEATVGDALATQLLKQRQIVFDEGSTIHLCSKATLKNFKYAEVYLSLWNDAGTIATIEAFELWKSLIMVTWNPDDSAQWEQAHPVTVLYQSKTN